jgi:hypothetical protein
VSEVHPRVDEFPRQLFSHKYLQNTSDTFYVQKRTAKLQQVIETGITCQHNLDKRTSVKGRFGLPEEAKTRFVIFPSETASICHTKS